jgi:hypothetical protein
MAQRDVSEGRKGIYYIGMIILIAGFLTFGSVFVSGIAQDSRGSGGFDNFDQQFREFEAQSKSMSTRAVVGMGMIVLGGVLMGIGRAGLAGSGVVLDPQQARADLEPWSRMAGGMVSDAADEAGIHLGRVIDHRDDSLPFDERLRRLHQLRTDGIITEEEYEREKSRILGSA